MTLIFDIVKNGKNISSKRNFHFDENGGTIGRLDSNDWVLTDPNSYISGKHASIICKQGTYFIKDTSTNGIFLKNPYKKLPKGHPIKINTSDVFIIGDHEIQARFSNNDYTQEDIIQSFKPSSSSDDCVIPNDDFLFDSASEDFIAVESEAPSKLDMLDILETPEDISEVITPSQEMAIPEDIFDEHIFVPTYTQETTTPASEPTIKASKPQKRAIQPDGISASMDILGKKLGIEINELNQKNRDDLMEEIGDIINNTLDSLKNSLEIKNKIKQDLKLSTVHLDTKSNNPVHLGAAATELIQNRNNGLALGMMKVSEAIELSFNELDTHNISLHRSSKNLMNITINKFSPKNLEYRFEAMGALRSVLPKQQLLWKAYVDMFEVLNENPEEGVSMIQEEFTKEYENISYSLKLQTSQSRNKI